MVAAWINRAKELIAEGIFTPANPGKWAGKAGSHTPVGARQDNNIIINVPHGMTKVGLHTYHHT